MSGEDTRKQIEEVRKAMAERAKRTHTLIGQAVIKACLKIETTAKKLMTETEVNMDVSYGRRQHHPSLPGHAPAVDYGTLRNSVTHSIEESDGKVRGFVGSIIKDPPYPQYLEDGTSKMAARPWLGPSIDQNRDEIKHILGQAARGERVGGLDVVD